jgi:hypothetical protein
MQVVDAFRKSVRNMPRVALCNGKGLAFMPNCKSVSLCRIFIWTPSPPPACGIGFMEVSTEAEGLRWHANC